MENSAAAGAFHWLNEDGVRVAAIAGICKNAGKTTLLNHLLARYGNEGWGVFSTGIDGEETDTVFRTPKPRVNLAAGQFFCCDTTTLESHGAAVAILEKTTVGTATRQLWLASTVIPVQTEITGPGSVTDQIAVLERMQALGAKKVLIDGSLDRKSIALSPAVEAVAILIGASFGSVAAIAGEIRRLELLNHIPASGKITADPEDHWQLLDSEDILILERNGWSQTGISSLLGCEAELKRLLAEKPAALYIPGALTDAVYARIRDQLLQAGTRVILRHPDCLKLSLAKLEQFIRDFSPTALIPFKIRTFALNTQAVGNQNIDAEEFRARLRREFPRLNLPDIRELEL